MNNYKPVSYNPAAGQTLNGIFDLFMRQYLGGRLGVMQPVEIVSVSGKLANVRPLIAHFDTSGSQIPITVADIIPNVPICQPYGANGRFQFQVVPGDQGLLIACNWDASNYKSVHTTAPVGSGRMFNWSDGFFIPLDFQDLPDGLLIDNGSSIAVKPDGITANTPTFTIKGNVIVEGNITCSGSATVTGEVTGKNVKLSTHTHGTPSANAVVPSPVPPQSTAPTPGT